MAHVRVVWGPYKTEERKKKTIWLFTGVYVNGSFARWKLTFWYDTRTFRTRAISKSAADDRNLVGQQDFFLPEVERAEPKSGRVTDMLRAKLTPEQLARATARAIAYRR